MKIGIFTYGTRGDLQPYIAIALGLMKRGNDVMIAAAADFRQLVEGYGISFHPLYGEAEQMMNTEEAKAILQSGNQLQLMKYYFSFLHSIRQPLRKSYEEAFSKVDGIVANSMTIPITSVLAEKYNKKLVLTYFMPPVVETAAYPISDFDFLNFGWYNKLTYRLAQSMFWKYIKDDVNEYRVEQGMKPLRTNLIKELDRKCTTDLYCISKHLIPQPADWKSHHKITGFVSVEQTHRNGHMQEQLPEDLKAWLAEGDAPVYIGFGSNAVGDAVKVTTIVERLLKETNYRVLFCTGWAVYDSIPQHERLYVAKYLNHEQVFPRCSVGVFHGGAGTFAAMLRHGLPVVIVSFYTDQPTWGKIAVKKQLGTHVPYKQLSFERLKTAIAAADNETIRTNAKRMGQAIVAENGLENVLHEIEAGLYC